MFPSTSGFKTAVEESGQWLAELAVELGVSERRAARALRAGLHTIRDRLPAVDAVDLGAQLPLLLRGLYYEGWRLAAKLVYPLGRREVLQVMEQHLGCDAGLDPEEALKAVFRLLERRLPCAGARSAYASVPDPMAELWAEASRGPM